MTRPALAFPKPSTFRDPAYLAWVRLRPCLVCHSGSQAHHIEVAGMAIKGSDYRTLPLCHRCHRQLHSIGRIRFEEKHKLDFEEEVIRLLEMYIAATREDLGAK